jgi:aldehyde dehydrogenase (NAD+)
MDTEGIEQLFDRQRCRAGEIARLPVADRRARLRRLRAAIVRRQAAILEAIHADLGRPAFESETAEFHHVLQEIDHAIRHVGRWARGRRVRAPLLLAGTTSRLLIEPRGTVLILAPWNYPFGLIVNPLVAAIAAGNCAVVKPSEKAPATAALLAEMLGEVFEEGEVAVVQGGPDVAAQLLELPFDHFFFTGSTRVGRLVMAAAARHLATVTLELGGKTPAVVDASADVARAAERIVWGKLFNAGQTCVAPDFVLVHEAVHDRFLEAVGAAVARFYGNDADARRRSPDFGRIVDDEHLERLTTLVSESVAQGAKVPVGGEWDAASRYFAPTVLSGVTPEMRIMREEIFGPVLPVLAWRDLREAQRLARRNGKPLASYIFTRDRRVADALVHGIPAGGTLINHTLLHYVSSELPFGGVGASGMGSYHGHHGFLAMSHVRPVVRQHGPAVSAVMYPPFRGRLHALVRRAIPWLR